MNGDKVKPVVTDERRISTIATNIDILATNNKPKDPEDFENSDDVILMKRETIVDEEVSYDVTDPRTRARAEKPSAYTARKIVAQGMMDIALLTSNANQLRNLIVHQRQDRFFFFVMSLIILSLVLQISVGVCLIFKGRFDVKNANKDKEAAARVNIQVMAAVFVITVVNIFIAAFSIPENAGTTPNADGNATRIQ